MASARQMERDRKKVLRSPEEWQERLQVAVNQRAYYEPIWEACEEAYTKGDVTWSRPTVDEVYGGSFSEGVRVNRVKPLVDTAHAATTLNHPRIKIYPRVGGDHRAAVWAERWANQMWEKYEAHEEFRAMAKDAHCIGHGWLKTGWHHVEQDRQRQVAGPTVETEAEALAEQLIAFEEENPELADDLPQEEDVIAGIEEQAEFETITEVVESRPFVERISPYDIWVDPTAARLRDCRYIVQRVFRSIDDVRNDESYNKTTRMKVVGGLDNEIAIGWEVSGRNQGFQGVDTFDDRLVAVYEYWSLEDDYMWGVWTPNTDGGWLVDPEPWPVPDLPFIYVPFDPLPSTFYPVGQVFPILNLQTELNSIRTLQLDFLDNYVPKVLMSEDMLSDEMVFDLGSDAPLQVLRAKVPPNGSLRELAIPFPQPGMPLEWPTLSEQVVRDIDFVGGMPDYSTAPNRRRSATEAAIQQDQSAVRAQDKNNIFERAAAETSRRWVGMAQEFLMGEVPVVFTTGDENGEQERRMDYMERHDILSEREFEFKIEVGSMAPRDDAVNRLEKQQLLQQLVPLMQAGVVNPRAVAEMVLIAHGVTNIDDFIVGEQWQEPAPPGGSPGQQEEGAPQPNTGEFQPITPGRVPGAPGGSFGLADEGEGNRVAGRGLQP